MILYSVLLYTRVYAHVCARFYSFSKKMNGEFFNQAEI